MSRGISPLEVCAAFEKQMIRGGSTRSGGRKGQRLPSSVPCLHVCGSAIPVGWVSGALAKQAAIVVLMLAKCREIALDSEIPSRIVNCLSNGNLEKSTPQSPASASVGCLLGKNGWPKLPSLPLFLSSNQAGFG